MFKLDLDDLPVPAILVDLRPLSGLAGRRVDDVAPEVLAPLLRRCLAVRANKNALSMFGVEDALQLNDNGCFRGEWYDWTCTYLSSFWTGEQTPWHETVVQKFAPPHFHRSAIAMVAPLAMKSCRRSRMSC